VDTQLEAKLRSEGSGILNRIITSAQGYLAEGLAVPEGVRMRTRAYVLESDVIQEFIEERLSNVDGSKVGAEDMYNAYKSHHFNGGLKPMSSKQFKAALEAKGFTQGRDGAGRFWSNVLLRPRNRLL
jgi:putative DNA primase/helicase